MRRMLLLVTPWHVPIQTSRGLVTFRPGDLQVPADLSRVKLLIEHGRDVVVSFAIEQHTTTAGLTMLFEQPAEYPEAKAAFDSAARGLRDGVSPGIEMDSPTMTRIRRAGPGVSVAGAGLLREVSLCAVAAHPDARVLGVTP